MLGRELGTHGADFGNAEPNPNRTMPWSGRRLLSTRLLTRANGPNRFKELRRRGVSKFLAAVAAGSPTGFWRMSGHPAVQQALRNHYFDSLGLPRLHVSVQA